MAQAGIFFERQIEGIDRQNLEGALRKLGASRTLELYLRLSRAKPIAAVYVSARRVKLRLKDGVKRVLANFYPACGRGKLERRTQTMPMYQPPSDCAGTVTTLLRAAAIGLLARKICA